MPDYYKKSLALHRQKMGKWGIRSKFPLKTRADLSVAYTPGVAAVSQAVAKDIRKARSLTSKGNTVAIVSNGTAVLGLGNIGPQAALPVMEGKAILFKEFADIDGVPLVIEASTAKEMAAIVKAIAPTFGGINLEDIAAPVCFDLEESLQDIGIPVFHDDQHGTAIVVYAALMNACQVTGKRMNELTVVVNGAGAAGTAVTRFLACCGHDSPACSPVKELLVCDSKGIISPSRQDLNRHKKKMLACTNRGKRGGALREALRGADVFIGVSKGNLLGLADIRTMAADPIIFAMANPVPEIMPDKALAAGAAVVGTGRSDFANQINNVLAFPGIFRGALDAKAERITPKMKLAAALALARYIKKPTAGKILPDVLDRGVARAVAKAVARAAKQ